MPELPEVESLRRSLEPRLVGRMIVRAAAVRRDMLVAPGDPPGGFSRSRSGATPVRLQPAWMLDGATIGALDRHGKQLAIRGVPGDAGGTPGAIVIHLGMTGAVRVLDRGEPRPPHTHACWTLEDGGVVAFSDPRRFGLVRLLPDGTDALWALLGPDALTVRAPALAGRLAGTTRAAKAALLDQSVIAGVGNIYADEALFASRIHPCAPAHTLGPDRVGRLAGSIRSILRRAIERGGSTIRDYRDGTGRAGGYQNAHQVYGRGGSPCPRCGYPLEQLQVAQRTTVACQTCQPR